MYSYWSIQWMWILVDWTATLVYGTISTSVFDALYTSTQCDCLYATLYYRTTNGKAVSSQFHEQTYFPL